MAPAALTSYGKDEKVLCFHGDILYEAKILDLRHTDEDDIRSPYEYLVHYKGWKATYVSSFCSTLRAVWFPFCCVYAMGGCVFSFAESG